MAQGAGYRPEQGVFTAAQHYPITTGSNVAWSQIPTTSNYTSAAKLLTATGALAKP